MGFQRSRYSTTSNPRVGLAFPQLTPTAMHSMLPQFLLRRNLHQLQHVPKFGVALDIDGVLLRGVTALPGAKAALEKLHQHNIPFLFMTNGGGYFEQEKAEQLASIFQIPVDENQIILSHTPMRALREKYKDKKILFLGSRRYLDVAKHYGFNKPVTVTDLAQVTPDQYPFHEWDKRDKSHLGEEPIAAIMTLHDPTNWAPELQITIDALQGGLPLGAGRECGTQTPFYLSNQDFIFSGTYPVPRFAQGAFTECLGTSYEKLTGKKLVYTAFGKPNRVTYEYAERVLTLIYNAKAGVDSSTTNSLALTKIYGIGDNPLSDIQGANNAGDHWRSILLRSGVFNGQENDATHPGDHVCDTVADALDYILAEEDLSSTR